MIRRNPPFVGYDFMENGQKEDMRSFFGPKTGRLDYVTAWYIKSAKYIEESSVRRATINPWKYAQGRRRFYFDGRRTVRIYKKEPLSAKWIHPYIGAVEFINSKKRYCLWLVNASPTELKKCPLVMKRIQDVQEFRYASKAALTRKAGDTPTRFCQIAQPDTDFLIVPKTSSGRRRYVPIGFATKDIIVSDLVFIVPDASLYEFGILSSNVHNAWLRIIGGRLKSDYRYSRDIVYNTFPWPAPTPDQRTKIEQTAQAILDARAFYQDSSLADLYDEITMPPELRRAHQQNDIAVMHAYGWKKGDAAYSSEADCVAELMKLYQQMVQAEAK